MRNLFSVLAIAAIVCLASACSNPVASKAPVKAAPTKVAASRYILISGRQPDPGCTDLGNGYESCP